MTIKSKQLFILIGDNDTGKTTFQKLLMHKMCGHWFGRLPANTVRDIKHPEIKRKYINLSIGSRSYQEKTNTYKTVGNYFEQYFQPADIAFISSHLVISDITQMISEGKAQYYNVNGVFFTYSIKNGADKNGHISRLEWDERFVVENPHLDDARNWNEQMNRIVENVVDLIISKTSVS